MAAIRFTNIMSTSFHAYVYDLDTTYERTDRYIDWYLNEIYWGRSYLGAYVSTSDLQYIYGLTAVTAYTVEAVIHYTDTAQPGADITKGLSGWCTTAPARPAFFDWNTSKVSGNAFNLTANEWNALLYNINAVRTYYNISPYDFSYADSGYPFTADMYNQAVYAIQEIYGYGGYLSTVSKGDIIYASYLNTLASELNAIPAYT